MLNVIGTAFLWVFTVESFLKIFALGAFKGYKTYFKQPWNVLDFIIVISGLVEFILERY